MAEDRIERFGATEEEVLVPPCWTCKHKHPGQWTCAAFKQGIPMDIRSGKHQHRTPHAGDNGIRYEREDGVSED